VVELRTRQASGIGANRNRLATRTQTIAAGRYHPKVQSLVTDQEPRAPATTPKDLFQIQKEYAPLIDDKSLAFNRRSMALAECINAGVFRDSIAFEKTAQLMDDFPETPDSLKEQRLGFPPLVQAVSPLVPRNLELIEL